MSVAIEVSAGAHPYRWLRIKEEKGASISAAEVQLSLTPSATGVHDWRTPDETEQVDPSTVRAALIVTGIAPGLYQLCAKITDDPEVEILRPVDDNGDAVHLTIK